VTTQEYENEKKKLSTTIRRLLIKDIVVVPTIMTLTLFVVPLAMTNNVVLAKWSTNMLAIIRTIFGMIGLLTNSLNENNDISKGLSINAIATGVLTMFVIGMVYEPTVFAKINPETMAICLASVVFIFLSAENAAFLIGGLRKEDDSWKNLFLFLALYLVTGIVLFLCMSLAPRISFFAK